MLEGLAGSALIAAAEAAVQHLLATRDGRQRINQILQPIEGAGRTAAKDWLADPRTAHLLVSEDTESLLQAELRLRDAVLAAGGEVPDDLAVTVRAASRLLVERLPSVPEIRAVGLQLARQHESAERQRSEQLELLRETRADVAVLRAATRSPIRALHPRVAELLLRADDHAAAQHATRVLREVPTSAGLDALLESLGECMDPLVWEAIAHYAALRAWHATSQSIFQAAAERSAHPERLHLWAAWQANTHGDVDAARAILEDCQQGRSDRFYLAVAAYIDGSDFVDVDDVDFTDSDDLLVALVAIESLSKRGNNDRALDIVARWRDAAPTPGTKAVEASLRWVRQVPAVERLSQLQLSLDLSLDAWHEMHALGLPARLAGSTAVQVAVDLNAPERVREIVTATNPFRAEELGDSDVAAQAQMALELLQEEGDLGDQLSEFDRRLFELMRPVVSSIDAPHPPTDDLLELLELATSPTQKARALLVLARSGYVDESGELERLRAEHPGNAALVEAAYLSATGDPDGAAAKLRPFAPDHFGAATELVHVYESADRPLDALSAALDVWDRDRDPMFITHAAGLLADPPTAIAADERLVERMQNAVSEAQSSLGQRARLGGLFEALTVVYLNRGQFSRALTSANNLHALNPGANSRWRIALCHAALGNHVDAWATLAPGNDVPRPRNDSELRLLAALIHSQAKDPSAVDALLAYAPLAQDPDIQGIALLSAQGALDRCGASEGLARRVWEAIHGFALANPESTVIQVLKIDTDDPLGSITRQFPHLRRGLSAEERRFNGQVLSGRLPYTLAGAVVRKSPTALLSARSGPLHAASGHLLTRQRERAAARAAVGQRVALDITALAVLADLHEAGCVDLAAFVRPFVATPIAQDVASHANDQVGSGVFAPTSNPAAPVTIIEHSEDEQRRQMRRQQAMQVMASRLPKEVVIGATSVVEPRSDMNDQEYVAWAGGEAAHRNGVPLWADDDVLRQVLRNAGVDTFNTRALADALLSEGRIDRSQHAAIRDAFRDAWVTDLPATINEAIERVETGHADGKDVLALRLPGWWAAARHRQLLHWVELFAALNRHNPSVVPEWFGNASVGLVLLEGGSSVAAGRFLLMLLSALPGLRSQADAIVEATNQCLWCIPAELTTADIGVAARGLGSTQDVADAVNLIDETLGSSSVGRAAREALAAGEVT